MSILQSPDVPLHRCWCGGSEALVLRVVIGGHLGWQLMDITPAYLLGAL